MSERLVIDPVTRIDGHLRVEVEIKDGKVVDAYSSGTMVPLLEEILKGRDPRDAWVFVGRVCGVCTTVHSLTSCRAVEDAPGIVIPPNAELVRNIMETAQYMQDHVIHFYHLHALDWVDVASALKTDSKMTREIQQSISNHSKSSPGYFSDVQKRLQTFVNSGQLGIFANGYWGRPAYKPPPEINLIGVAHYLEALEWQKEIVKIHAIFGGKNPHPNYLVGGMAFAINTNEANALNAERLAYVHQLLVEAKEFVNNVYIPDILAVAPYYLDLGGIGGGLSNYLAYGDLPTRGYGDVSSFKFPRGIILDRDLSKVHEVDARDHDEIQEFIKHSRYSYSDGDEVGKFPWEGESTMNYTGPKPPYEHLNVDGKYSWVKTPQWKGKPMEVGPLSRVLVGYASGKEEFVENVNAVLAKLDVPATALFSTLGRTAARVIETKLTADWGLEFMGNLFSNIKNGDERMANTEKFEKDTWPAEAKGVGLMEAPLGALAHWIVIEDQKIKNYRLVVPSTWNSSPRDPAGQRSSYEEALLGTPVADPEQPVEILRTLQSFDPCMACAVHLYDDQGNEYDHELEIF